MGKKCEEAPKYSESPSIHCGEYNAEDGPGPPRPQEAPQTLPGPRHALGFTMPWVGRESAPQPTRDSAVAPLRSRVLHLAAQTAFLFGPGHAIMLVLYRYSPRRGRTRRSECFSGLATVQSCAPRECNISYTIQRIVILKRGVVVVLITILMMGAAARVGAREAVGWKTIPFQGIRWIPANPLRALLKWPAAACL
jgi:hypothetical protein